MSATTSRIFSVPRPASSDARPVKAVQERAVPGGFWKMMLETSEVAVRHHYARPWLRDAGTIRPR